jgi:hypothetical protein
LGVSLRNLLDSAASLGRLSVRLRLGAKSAALLDVPELLELGGAFGQPRVERQGDAILLEVTGLVAPVASATAAARRNQTMPERAATVEAHAAQGPVRSEPASFADYERRLRELATVPQPGALELAAADVIGVSFERAGSALELEVRPSDHVVATARARGADEVDRLLLGELARLVVGLPMLEACYHGALRLEHRLRPVGGPRPVPGIVLPSAVHPRFAAAQELLRGVLAAYRERSGYDAVRGEYDERPKAQWVALDFVGRKQRLDAAIAPFMAEHGLTAADAQVVSIRYDVRVELGLSEAWRRLDQPRLVMALERELQARVDPRLEVYVQELKDKNQLRRLALVETPE